MKKLLLLILAIGFLFPVFAQNVDSVKKPLVIFLARHAEKVDSSRDPELSEAGKQRAKQLAETLISTEIEYIHSTDFIRTKNTVAPSVQTFNLDVDLYNPRELEAFAAALKQKGGRHLVVGHSNTTPALVKLLGGEPGTPIDEKNEYDRLYILSFQKDGNVSTVLMRYGKKCNSGIIP